MKYSKLNLLGLAMAFIALPSCLDSDNDVPNGYSNALVTVKSTADNKTFMQLDEQTTLFPQNLKSQLYNGKEVRALMNYDKLDTETPGFSETVHVNWIDSIRTKDMVNLQDNTPIENYGNDPVEIINDWVTIAEDGYLTLRIRTLWGEFGKTHVFNLIGNINKNDPFEVELCHNANGDIYGNKADALIAFRLSSLPKQIPSDQKLTLKWKSFDGTVRQAQFNLFSKAVPNHSQQGLGTLVDAAKIE